MLPIDKEEELYGMPSQCTVLTVLLSGCIDTVDYGRVMVVVLYIIVFYYRTKL